MPSLICPKNTKTIDEAGEIAIDQVVIGSCTNGRLNDMKIAAEILRGKQVHPKVRTIVIPATQQIYLDCIRLGYVEDIVKAGAIFSTPYLRPCLGGHMGILAAGERCVSTTNRNFVGRMGHTESEVYLASPRSCGSICHRRLYCRPRKRLQEGGNNGNSKRESL